jgi:hypothetical protein
MMSDPPDKRWPSRALVALLDRFSDLTLLGVRIGHAFLARLADMKRNGKLAACPTTRRRSVRGSFG